MGPEKIVETTDKPQTTPEVKVDTVKEAAARIALGEKIRHPGPWVTIKPRAGLSVAQEVVLLQKDGLLVGYDPKTGKGLFKRT